MAHNLNLGTTIGVATGVFAQPLHVSTAIGTAAGVTVHSHSVGTAIGAVAASGVYSRSVGTAVGVSTGGEFDIDGDYSLGTAIGTATGCTIDASELRDVLPMIGSDVLREQRERRGKHTEERPFGTLRVYTRVFRCPRGKAEDYETGLLALGQPMYSTWLAPDDADNAWVDGPKVLAVQRRNLKESSGNFEEFVVQFAALILPVARAAGYNETARTTPVSEGTYHLVMETWGITKRVGASNEPEVGDMLDDVRRRPTRFRCVEKAYDKTSLPGRTLVHCVWRRFRNDTRRWGTTYVTG